MSSAPLVPVAPQLRSDLEWLAEASPAERGTARQALLFDPITRTFVRIARDQADRLIQSPQDCDPQLLAAADAAGLLQSRRSAAAPRWRLGQLLSIRLPGIASAPLAAVLARHTNWLFSPLAVLAWLAVILAACLAIPVYWSRFHANLAGIQEFFSAGNTVLLIGTLIVTKLIHELAHATVCYRLGARPGAIGVLLLCGAPCPYCDVTDSWRLSSSAHRAWIMLAGVYVECIMAAIALLVWWVTSAGVLHFAAMNVMVVCGISTLLFNLNPLMRYDGYYVLAELCGSANLRQEAADAFAALVVRPLAGPAYRTRARASRRNVFLALYHAASACYRVLITLVIAGWLVSLCGALSMRPVGLMLAAVWILALPCSGLRRLSATLRGAGAWRDVGGLRRWSLSVALVGLLLAALLIPLPQGFRAHGTIDVAGATPVYLPEAGRVAEVLADYGDAVNAGQPLMQLQNIPLQLQAVELLGSRQALQSQTDQLHRRAIDQTHLLKQWDSQQAMLQSMLQRERRLQERLSALRVIAPTDGVVLPPLAEVKAAPLADPIADERWQRSLHWGQGGWAQAEGYWCRIGDPAALEVVLEIDARERSRVHVGDEIRVACAPGWGDVLRLRIETISTINTSESRATGTQNRFRVACPIPPQASVQWAIGSPATARLRAPAESLASRTRRWLKEYLHAG